MNLKSIKYLLLSSTFIPLAGLATLAKADIPEADFQKAIEKYLSTDKGQENLAKTLETIAKNRQAQAAKAQKDQEAAELENQFKNPVKIDIGKSPSKGNASAKITIIEFSDFQCPFCKRGKDTMDQVLKKYPNDVKLVFKNYPLEFHPNAAPAAKAALAAGKQGKFFEFHDELFDNQAKLSDAFYLDTAKKLGLNVDKFKTDMASAEVAAALEEDKKIASANGIQGTPGFFVNGVAVKGAYPAEHFDTIIARLMKQ